jgi:hypothetical protein
VIVVGAGFVPGGMASVVGPRMDAPPRAACGLHIPEQIAASAAWRQHCRDGSAGVDQHRDDLSIPRTRSEPERRVPVLFA